MQSRIRPSGGFVVPNGICVRSMENGSTQVPTTKPGDPCLQDASPNDIQETSNHGAMHGHAQHRPSHIRQFIGTGHLKGHRPRPLLAVPFCCLRLGRGNDLRTAVDAHDGADAGGEAASDGARPAADLSGCGRLVGKAMVGKASASSAKKESNEKRWYSYTGTYQNPPTGHQLTSVRAQRLSIYDLYRTPIGGCMVW